MPALSPLRQESLLLTSVSSMTNQIALAVCVAVSAAILFSACTDTAQASLGAYGTPATITCYSGGQAVFTARSTGRVMSSNQSDGWNFKDAMTGKFTRVSGDCVVVHE